MVSIISYLSTIFLYLLVEGMMENPDDDDNDEQWRGWKMKNFHLKRENISKNRFSSQERGWGVCPRAAAASKGEARAQGEDHVADYNL